MSRERSETPGWMRGLFYARRFKRDLWYLLVCALCGDKLVVSGAQINAGRSTCVECGKSWRHRARDVFDELREQLEALQ